jgi:hypothetical protein
MKVKNYLAPPIEVIDIGPHKFACTNSNSSFTLMLLCFGNLLLCYFPSKQLIHSGRWFNFFKSNPWTKFLVYNCLRPSIPRWPNLGCHNLEFIYLSRIDNYAILSILSSLVVLWFDTPSRYKLPFSRLWQFQFHPCL